MLIFYAWKKHQLLSNSNMHVEVVVSNNQEEDVEVDFLAEAGFFL
jgi:hypothetical protein